MQDDLGKVKCSYFGTIHGSLALGEMQGKKTGKWNRRKEVSMWAEVGTEMEAGELEAHARKQDCL